MCSAALTARCYSQLPCLLNVDDFLSRITTCSTVHRLNHFLILESLSEKSITFKHPKSYILQQIPNRCNIITYYIIIWVANNMITIYIMLINTSGWKSEKWLNSCSNGHTCAPKCFSFSNCKPEQIYCMDRNVPLGVTENPKSQTYQIYGINRNII